jgi:catechol 2,3-dioxygenase-like lactoylglutathione lyase family enzyme
MLQTSAILCFAATLQPERARKFYEETLGLRFVGDEPFALVFDANGTMFRVQKVQELAPANHTVLGWRVKDIHAEIKELAGRGVHFERFPGLTQDKLGVWTTPSGAKVAWFKDPDGNILSLTQLPE